MARPARRELSTLLIVDVQERLLPVIDDREGVLKHCERLIRAAGILGVPVVATEQYPKGLGPTVEPLRALLGPEAIRSKLAFSCCGAAGWVDDLQARGRPQIVVAGIEAHVCVQQTVLDLLAEEFSVYVAADAVSSRRPLDRWAALDRLRQAGAVVTTAEAIVFEWLRVAGTPEFKAVAKLVKDL